MREAQRRPQRPKEIVMIRHALMLGWMSGLVVLSMTAPGAADAQRYDRGGYSFGDQARGYGVGGRGYHGRRHRCDGTAGAILGAVAGGLLGNTVAGRGDRTAGMMVGGGLGALAGNAIGRDC
jgi:hypothetical protein